MKRALVALAVAASAVFVAAPASADHCGDTLQPPCQTCLGVFTDPALDCVPLDPHLIGG